MRQTFLQRLGLVSFALFLHWVVVLFLGHLVIASVIESQEESEAAHWDMDRMLMKLSYMVLSNGVQGRDGRQGTVGGAPTACGGYR